MSQAQNHILCMKWGDKYGPEYVNRLYNMVKQHLTLPFTFICLTDDPTGINPAVQCHPIPDLGLPPACPSAAGKSSPPSTPIYTA